MYLLFTLLFLQDKSIAAEVLALMNDVCVLLLFIYVAHIAKLGINSTGLVADDLVVSIVQLDYGMKVRNV